jgi:hypothetical protein
VSRYLEIIEPLGNEAKKCSEEYSRLYKKRLIHFSKEFNNLFTTNEDTIDWEKLVRFNSGRETVKLA